MPPIPPRDLTLSEVEAILRASEGRTSVHRDDEGAGHAHGRHVALTRDQLWERTDETRNGGIADYTAFVSTRDQIAAACETLNSAEGKWARNQFDQGVPTPRSPRGGRNGMYARIHHVGQLRIVRYAGGTGTMPASAYVMLLYRDDTRPSRLHIKTFYATTRPAPRPPVTVYNRDNSVFGHGP